MRINRLYLRSVRGQLSLLGAAYGGAVLLAVVAVCVRSIFFEHFFFEHFEPPSPRLQQLAGDLAAGRAGPAQVAVEKAEDRQVLYGAWLSQPAQELMARSLLAADGRRILERIRRTLVTGDLPQRTRAVELLGLVTADDLKPEARRALLHDTAAAVFGLGPAPDPDVDQAAAGDAVG